MRLILALAAHYKPSSVKQASQQHGQGSPMGAQSTPGTPSGGTPSRKARQPSFAAMAANAAAAIHDARKEAAGAGGSLRRYKETTPHRTGYGFLSVLLFINYLLIFLMLIEFRGCMCILIVNSFFFPNSNLFIIHNRPEYIT